MTLFVALSNLCGQSGRDLALEVEKTGIFTEEAFNWVKDNISFNSEESIKKYFGTVYYAYINSNHSTDLATIADQELEMNYQQ